MTGLRVRMLTALLATMWIAAMAHASPPVPTGPSQPESRQDCIDAFAGAFRQHFQSKVCQPCYSLEGFPGSRWARQYAACWDRCSAQKQSLFQRLTGARNACFDRAHQLAQDLRGEAGERIANAPARAARAARNAAEAAQELTPRRFFANAVGELPPEVSEFLRAKHRDNATAVEAQVHKYAFTLASSGTTAAALVRRSPILSAIPAGSLARLAVVHDDTLRQYDAVLAEASQAPQPTTSIQPRFRPSPLRSFSGADLPAVPDECAVLATTAAADLAADEPDRFEALTQRCRQSSPRGER